MQYIARWYSENPNPMVSGVRRTMILCSTFLTADNPAHAEQLIKQYDPGAERITLEQTEPFKGG